MSRFRPYYGAPDFGASLGLALAVLGVTQTARAPRIPTKEEINRRAKADELSEWNRQVEERKAAKRATKEAK